MALLRQIGFYDEPASLTRNYGTRVLPSQLDAWLGPTSESLAPTGGLAGCWPAYPPILCGPSKTRSVCVNSNQPPGPRTVITYCNWTVASVNLQQPVPKADRKCCVKCKMIDIDSENALVGCTLERWKVGVFSVPTSEDLKSIKNSLGGDLPLVLFLKLSNRIAKCAQGCRAPRASPPT